MDNVIEALPLISVIMPAYNASRFIDEAISSVLAQTYKNWELVVIDDGSTDNTAAIIKKHQQTEPRIKYHFQGNEGLGAARNTGLILSTGAWIAFLDADDIWVENKLHAQVDIINNQAVDIIYSSGFYLDNETQTLAPYDTIYGPSTGAEIYSRLIQHNTIPVLSVCISKKLIEQLGLQDTNPLVRGCEDWDYWLRASLLNARFWGIEQRLFKYRMHGTNMSGNVISMQVAIAYVMVKNYRVKQLTQQAINTVKEYLAQRVILMIRHIRLIKPNMRVAYLKLVLNVTKISGGSFVAFLLKKSKSKLALSSVNGG